MIPPVPDDRSEVLEALVLYPDLWKFIEQNHGVDGSERYGS